MLTSKELLAKAGISRATLNNYVALGILPRPVVKKPASGRERARQLGYFPDGALERIAAVRRLKKEGLSMGEIASTLRVIPEGEGAPGPAAREPEHVARGAAGITVAGVEAAGVKLTLGELEDPAYMVNQNFLVEWCNDRAATGLFGLSDKLDPEIAARSFFKLFLCSPAARHWADRDELLRFHLAIAKVRVPKRSLAKLGSEVSDEDWERLQAFYDEVEPAHSGTLSETHLNFARPEEEPRWHSVYATFFREGILFIHRPVGTPAETILNLLARRDQLIRDVVRKRQPHLTALCVLVADLQDSVKICAELPPEEYFELVNQIWQMAERILRKYHATQGKHAGDGMVSYFFPQPDRNYILGALVCAKEIKEKMRGLSKEWQLRKNWANELYMNIGLNEGEEWFGTVHSGTSVELTVLGDTINHAGRLSDFARCGAVWVTKSLVGKMKPEERGKVRFGIRRTDEDGREIWVPATFSRLSNLIDLGKEKHEKLRDIATLTIAEVADGTEDDDGTGPRGRS